ncbi:putative helix-turn-helix DNA binding protein [Mycobacterium phage PP]|uniref:Putative helix-turn-helix DNA binding protein n=1 Tax=Mycobacterium phage PP TaxID=2077134 RepID=A0A2Z5XVI5_9CAUD|nr:putative helix-turn-helix DNA binding protein [Mycobacterium phage PP]BBC53863.1 putative helix-turn-helix DNA binding protein [Mycobacterium phage PP]
MRWLLLHIVARYWTSHKREDTGMFMPPYGAFGPSPEPEPIPRKPDQTHTRDTSGPEWEPGKFDPNHRLLTSNNAPHETGGVMRVHRTGRPALVMSGKLKMPLGEIQQQLYRDMHGETRARELGLPVYDSQMPKGTV